MNVEIPQQNNFTLNNVISVRVSQCYSFCVASHPGPCLDCLKVVVIHIHHSRSPVFLFFSFLELLYIQRLNVRVIDDVCPHLHHDPVFHDDRYTYCHPSFPLFSYRSRPDHISGVSQHASTNVWLL